MAGAAVAGRAGGAWRGWQPASGERGAHLKGGGALAVNGHLHTRGHPARRVQRPSLAPCAGRSMRRWLVKGRGRNLRRGGCRESKGLAKWVSLNRQPRPSVPGSANPPWVLQPAQDAGLWQAGSAPRGQPPARCGSPDSSVFHADVAEGSTCQLAPLRAGPTTSHLRQGGEPQQLDRRMLAPQASRHRSPVAEAARGAAAPAAAALTGSLPSAAPGRQRGRAQRGGARGTAAAAAGPSPQKCCRRGG